MAHQVIPQFIPPPSAGNRLKSDPQNPPKPGPQAPITVFAVLGGVASGKSTVAKLLAGKKGQVLAADGFAHEALDLPETHAFLLENFGEEALDSSGQVDRAYLATRVFSNPEELARLEDWIHPRVRARIWAERSAARARAVPRIVLDVPLLLESSGLRDLVDEIDYLVFLDVPLKERERRAGVQRGWAQGEVAKREAAQMPLEEKRKAAHFVLDASLPLAELQVAATQLLTSCGL